MKLTTSKTDQGHTGGPKSHKTNVSRRGSQAANKLLLMEQCVTPATALLPEVTQVAQNPTKQIAQHGKPKDSSRIPAYYLEASGGNNTACGAIFFTGGVVFR